MSEQPKRPIKFNVVGTKSSRMSGANGLNASAPPKTLPGNRAAASFIDELKKANEPKAG